MREFRFYKNHLGVWEVWHAATQIFRIFLNDVSGPCGLDETYEAGSILVQEVGPLNFSSVTGVMQFRSFTMALAWCAEEIVHCPDTD
jgi:hypothetical protein